MNALIVVGKRHRYGHSQKLLDLLRRDQRPLLRAVEQNANPILKIELFQV